MSSHLEERLREAAALGDLELVQALLHKGVAVNARNEINGWTCLHWACKRNHPEVVAYLLDSGADTEILTVNGELAAHLTSKKEIKKILGVEDCDQEADDAKLPIVANYPTNPFPHNHSQAVDSVCGTSAPPEVNFSPCFSAVQTGKVCTVISFHNETELSGGDHSDGQLTSPIRTAASAHSELEPKTVQNCPIYPSLANRNRVLFPPPAPKKHGSHQENGTCTNSAPPLQPLLLTGTLPYNAQELVLKVRVQNTKENDFIEIELDRQGLTYQDLLRVSCCELGINPQQVEKIRKLPNTLIR
ncbi:ankyrin repeat domain-containing protein 40 [Pogona vitticeps]